MARDKGRSCYDGSESDLQSFLGRDAGDALEARADQSRYTSSRTAYDKVDTSSSVGTKTSGGVYGKGQAYAGPYTDSSSHVTPSPDYDDVGNPKGSSGPDERAVKGATAEAENSEDYIQPIYPSRGLSEKLPKR